jgi:RHS repeat-associated protein
MTVDTDTGVIDWTPTLVGTQAVTLRVTDQLGAYVDQTYNLEVLDPAVANLRPSIDSTPTFQAPPDLLYSYQVDASDPNNDTLTYSLPTAPAGMTIDAATGLIQWTPTTAEIGSHSVTLQVADATFWVTQSYTVIVRDNAAPVIQAIADTSRVAGKRLQLAVTATDPDADPLTYALTTAPAGMIINQDGRIVWLTTPADAATHPVTVTVTDSWGASTDESFNVFVIADTELPTVTLLASSNPAELNSTVTVTVRASDNVRVSSRELTVDGVPVPLDASGSARITLDSMATRALAATVTDPTGNTATDTLNLTVIDPSDVNQPVVGITTPADDDILTAPTDVVGSVTDPDGNLVSWTLTLSGPAGNGLVVGSGTTEVTAGVLGQIDTTLLANGAYTLKLTATDAGNNTATTSSSITLDGNLKLGPFSIGFVDLQVPVAGIPITVSRSYSTLDANQQGDFGYGWSLDLSNTQIEVDQISGDLSGFGDYVPFRDGTRVIVTLPDDSTEGFTFYGAPGTVLFGTIIDYLPRFLPDLGVTSQLIVDEVSLRKVGEEYVHLESTLSYNPARYEFGGSYNLITRSGAILAINAETGDLASITDRNDNTLYFTGDGITSSNGRGVEFLRDYAGRITAVVDPNGNQISYAYDAAGDLVSVTDRMMATTQFSYLTTPAHYLDEITDPLGNLAARTEYDADGRIKKVIDADGQSIEYSYDLNQLTQTVTDQLGFVTTLTVDDRGNVLSEQDPLGGLMLRTFNQDDLVLSETTVVGQIDDAQNGETDDLTVSYTYDEFENLLTSTDVLGNSTVYTYNEFGQTLTVTDPLGNTTQAVYDAYGNLRRTIDPLGNSTIIDYDSQGVPSTITDPLGNTGSFTFSSFGDLTGRTDLLGNTTTFGYDAYGNRTGTSFSWVNPLDPADVRTITTTNDYDDNDRATRSVDTNGNESLTGYNNAGQISSTTDIYGETTNYLYDARGQLIETAYPDGTRTRTVYDAKGRVLYRDDRHPFGSSTDGSHTIYDAVDHVVTSERLADVVIDLFNNAGVYSSVLTSTGALLTTSSTTYDTSGRMTSSTNTHGHVTSYEYDDFGQTTAVERTMNVTTLRTEYEFDDFGRTEIVRDPYGRETQSVFDSFGRQTRTIHHDGRSNSSTYDSFGRTLTLLSIDGVLTSYEYDSFGRQSAIDVTADGVTTRTEFEFDVYGNQSLVRDDLGHETSYEFDQFRRTTATVFDDGSRVEVTFDTFGHVLTETNPLGLVKSFEYDSEGQLTAVVLPAVTDPATGQPANPRYEYEYDTLGNRTLVRDPEGHESSFTYDSYSQQTSRTLPTGETETFSYDARGRQTLHVDFAGRVIENVYDDSATGRGRVGEVLFFDDLTAYDNGNGTPAETVANTYDDLGRMTTVVDPRGTTSYTYNDDGLVIKVDSPEGIIRYEYEAVTNRPTRTYTTDATGEVTNDFHYSYDSLGRLKTVTVDERHDVPLATPEVTSYDYDALGNLDEVFLPNGIVSDYTYDNLNRLDTLTHYEPDPTPEDLSDNTKIAEFDYDVRADGRRTGVTETRYDSGSAETTRVDWTYDDLGRLTDEVFNHYDDLLDQSLHFTYDLVGNRLEQTLDKGNDATIDEKVTYTFDDNDRMLTESNDADNDGTVDTTTTYGYTATEQTSKTVVDEATGNTTSQTDYEYGLDGRMQTATLQTYDGTGTLTRKEVTTYDYDDSGIRVSALHEVDSDGDGTFDTRTETTYLVDHQNFTGHQQVLEEIVTDADTGSETERVVYTLGHDVVAQTTFTPSGPAEGDTIVLLYDGHGSTRFVADLAAQILEAYAYDAYGNAIGFNAAAALTTLLYSGEQFDSRIGQQYLRARYYNSATGTFNRLDPFSGNLRDPQSLHKYLYTHGDPINSIDPTGLFTARIRLVVSMIGARIVSFAKWAIRAGIRTGVRSLIPTPILVGARIFGRIGTYTVAQMIITRMTFAIAINYFFDQIIETTIDPVISQFHRLANALAASPHKKVRDLRVHALAAAIEIGRGKQQLQEANAMRHIKVHGGALFGLKSVWEGWKGIETFLEATEKFINTRVVQWIGALPWWEQVFIKRVTGVDKESEINFSFDRLKLAQRLWFGDTATYMNTLIFAVEAFNRGVQGPFGPNPIKQNQFVLGATELKSFFRHLNRFGELKIDPAPDWL